MTTRINPLAGKPAQAAQLVNVGKLLDAYFSVKPDPATPAQRVAFGTSGHRGSSFDGSFNENHILAIAQAICGYRAKQGIDGPLFIGIDTHALSQPAFETALEVLAANGVQVLVSQGGEYTPTPAVSHAILVYNNGRKTGLADGIVVTPSHNPPDNGGFKYNTPNGGPADTDVTDWIQDQANALLEAGLKQVRRIGFDQAMHASTTHKYYFLTNYVADLGKIVDFDAIRSSGIRMGVDPLGGAGVHYWARIADHYKINLAVVSEQVDPQFGFMTLDWDGKIRMDPSSPFAMQRLIGLKDKYDIAFACDTDHDRHGIVTRSTGLIPPNHYLSVLIDYLFGHRPAVEREGGHRQDRRQHRDDRSRSRTTGTQAVRGSGWLQVVRRWIVRWLARFRRRGKRRCRVPASQWQGVDHRQGRSGSGTAVGRDHRAPRQRSRRSVCRSHG